MMDLFSAILRGLTIYFSLPIFLICLVVEWAYRNKTARTFRQVFMRALVASIWIGLSILVVLAAWLTWWVINHVPAPD
jgi:hypothetical protein